MPLVGSQFEQVHKALLDAFDHDSLSQMVRFELGVRLDDLAEGQNYSVVVHRLIDWADREGRLVDLVDGALRQNPGNPNLQALAKDVKTLPLEPPEEGNEPYQGLNFFDVGDADRFFGREALTAELADYLRDHSLLAVIGASGSGKSSVVRAGMVPAMQGNKHWRIAPIITPTARPLETLATALVPRGARLTVVKNLMNDLRSDACCLHLHIRQLLNDDEEHDHLLLVVDQFEELFTLCRDKVERIAFVDNLLTAAAPDGVTTVILTLRADFYAHCAHFANLRTALGTDQRFIGAMNEAELLDAIVKPAEQGGWDLEPGLADRMLHDVTDEPGALPLLSHALLETWKRRSGQTLTFAGYHAAGGVQGAIAHTADSVYGQFDKDEKAIARNIFLRLTELGEGVQDTRRRVPLQELISRAETASMVERVLQKLQDQRLVTTVLEDTPTSEGEEEDAATGSAEPVIYVDVTHEALIREWPVLKDWLAEDREGLRTHRKLTEEAREWEKLGRDPGAFYRGLRLEQTAAWAEEHADDLNQEERAFLNASQALVETQRLEQESIAREQEKARQRELEQAQALAAEEIRARNRMRWLLMVVGLALVVALGATWFILRQNEDLVKAEATAVAGETIADNARAIAEANVELAQQQLQELEGLSLIEQAHGAKEAGDVKTAIAKFEAAVATDPTLGIDMDKEISETLRYVAIQLVHEGEELAAKGNYSDAAEKFEAALELNPPSDTPVYVWIPEGYFLMGSDNEDELAGDNERPQKSIFLDGYWILRTVVTNEQYKRCVDVEDEDIRCEPPANERWLRPEYSREPVTDVDWHNAVRYAAWVGGRLPTEAEWERACRGVDGAIYPWGDDPPDPTRLNYYVSGMNGIVPPGSYPPNGSGLYDMSGNVYEWTADLHSTDYYEVITERNPRRTEGDGYPTIRSSAWMNWMFEQMRCAHRSTSATFRGDLIGFRVVSPGP